MAAGASFVEIVELSMKNSPEDGPDRAYPPDREKIDRLHISRPLLFRIRQGSRSWQTARPPHWPETSPQNPGLPLRLS